MTNDPPRSRGLLGRLAWTLLVLAACYAAYSAIPFLAPRPPQRGIAPVGSGAGFWAIALDPYFAGEVNDPYATLRPVRGDYYVLQGYALQRVSASEVERGLERAMLNLRLDDPLHKSLADARQPDDTPEKVLARLERLVREAESRAPPASLTALRSAPNRARTLDSWRRFEDFLRAHPLPWEGWEFLAFCAFMLVVLGTAPPGAIHPALAALRGALVPPALCGLLFVVDHYTRSSEWLFHDAWPEPPIRTLLPWGSHSVLRVALARGGVLLVSSGVLAALYAFMAARFRSPTPSALWARVLESLGLSAFPAATAICLFVYVRNLFGLHFRSLEQQVVIPFEVAAGLTLFGALWAATFAWRVRSLPSEEELELQAMGASASSLATSEP